MKKICFHSQYPVPKDTKLLDQEARTVGKVTGCFRMYEYGEDPWFQIEANVDDEAVVDTIQPFYMHQPTKSVNI